jgi:hypothetical protein
MRGGKYYFSSVKRGASQSKDGRKNKSTKRKTIRRQVTLKASSWYERAALSIKAAPNRP